jgi:hypothetical protein
MISTSKSNAHDVDVNKSHLPDRPFLHLHIGSCVRKMLHAVVSSTAPGEHRRSIPHVPPLVDKHCTWFLGPFSVGPIRCAVDRAEVLSELLHPIWV